MVKIYMILYFLSRAYLCPHNMGARQILHTRIQLSTNCYFVSACCYHGFFNYHFCMLPYSSDYIFVLILRRSALLDVLFFYIMQFQHLVSEPSITIQMKAWLLIVPKEIPAIHRFCSSLLPMSQTNLKINLDCFIYQKVKN